MKPRVEATVLNLSPRIAETPLRRKHLVRSLSLALPIACAYFMVLVAGVLRVGPIEYMRFLHRNPYAEDRAALVRQLEESFEKIDAYDQQAFLNHQKLADHVVSIFKDPHSSDDLQTALRRS